MHMRSIVAMLLLLAATRVDAQEDTNFGEALEVRIINVDVVVRDQDGNPVPGLTAADFTIYDSGTPQTITNFAEYREEPAGEAPEQAAEAPVVAVRPPQKRYLVFFIDRLNLRERIGRDEFFRGLRSFVEDSMRDSDEAAIFFWGTSLHTLLPMTSDREALRAAIDALAEESKLRLDLTDIEKAELGIRERLWEGEDNAAMNIESDKRFAAQRAFNLQQRKIHAINSVIRSVSGLDGRKVMILATERLTKLPGLEYGYPSTEFNARRMLDSVVEEANAAAVTVYGFFPRGLERDQVSVDSYEQLMNQSEAIHIIAEGTGGTAATGGKLSALALENTARQLDNYYSLAYRAPDAKDDRSRSIKVKVSRKGLEVLARNSVIEKPDEEVARDRMISGILFGTGPSTIPIQVVQSPVRKKGLTTYIVPVEISIPISHLTTVPGAKGHDGKFRVLAVAANAEGDVADVAEKTQTFHIAARDLEKARTGNYKYSLEIIVRDTSNRALVAVIDDLDKEVGYAEVKLDLTKVAKNAPATNMTPSWQQRKPGSRGGATRPYP